MANQRLRQWSYRDPRLTGSKCFKFKVATTATAVAHRLQGFRAQRRARPRLVWMMIPVRVITGRRFGWRPPRSESCKGAAKPSLVKSGSSTAAPPQISPWGAQRVQLSAAGRCALLVANKGGDHLGNRWLLATNVSICGKCLSWRSRVAPTDGWRFASVFTPARGEARKSVTQHQRRAIASSTPPPPATAAQLHRPNA